jgi:hypothetical protein
MSRAGRAVDIMQPYTYLQLECTVITADIHTYNTYVHTYITYIHYIRTCITYIHTYIRTYIPYHNIRTYIHIHAYIHSHNMAQQTNRGLERPTVEISRSQAIRQTHPVGFLWMSDHLRRVQSARIWRRLSGVSYMWYIPVSCSVMGCFVAFIVYCSVGAPVLFFRVPPYCYSVGLDNYLHDGNMST